MLVKDSVPIRTHRLKRNITGGVKSFTGSTTIALKKYNNNLTWCTNLGSVRHVTVQSELIIIIVEETYVNSLYYNIKNICLTNNEEGKRLLDIHTAWHWFQYVVIVI